MADKPTPSADSDSPQDDSVRRELQFHIDMQTEENIRQGMELEEARREAKRAFGGVEQIREEARDLGRAVWLSDLARDASLAARMLARSPGFALTIVLILGMAIGLSTTIFSFVQAILVKPLPYPNADRLVIVQTVNPGREMQMYGVSIPDLISWREQATSFDGIAAFRPMKVDLTDGQSTQRVSGLSSTRNFFDVVGIPMAHGRTFTEQEEYVISGTIVLSHGLWKRRFRSDPNVVGKTQDVYSWTKNPSFGVSAWEVLGVTAFDMPFLPTMADVTGNVPGLGDTIEYWQPMWVYPKGDRRDRYQYTAVARLKPGVTLEQAAAEMKIVAKNLGEEFPESNAEWTIEVVPVEDVVTAEIRPALMLLCGAVAFVLLIACANVAGLLVVRGLARQQEFAVRVALGAGRWRLIRQLLTESLMLCLAGGLFGILVSIWSVDIVRALAPQDVPRLGEVRVDLGVLGFAIGLSVLTGLVVGVLPAVLGSTVDLSESLKSGGRGASAAKSRRRLMSALVIAEISVCLVLLTGAGLLIRSFAHVLSVDPGFRTDQLVTMTVSLPQAKYKWNHNSEFCVELTTKLRELPGVTAASAVRGVPTRETHFDCLLYIEGRPLVAKDELPQGKARVIEPDFFKAMEVPLLEGRLFEPPDSIGKIGYSKVTVCNETFAKRIFPGESPIGKRFCIVDPGVDPIEIVGVVGDVKFAGLSEEPAPAFYYPEALFPQAEFTLVVRTDVNPDSMLATIEQLVFDAEPDVVITRPQSMNEIVSESLSRERFLMLLLSAFSVGALILSVTGHYGVMAYSVSQRRREIGIRTALGATTGQIVWKITAEGLLLAGIGLAIGIAASLGCGRLIEAELFGVESTDPLTMTAAVGLLLLASVVAVMIPAVRGARIHPAEVLRSE